MSPGGDQHINLTVKSTSGQFTDKYNLNNKAQKVFDEAIRRFQLSTSGGVTYTLKREADNRVLALDEKLEGLGLVNGDILVLQTNQAQDG